MADNRITHYGQNQPYLTLNNFMDWLVNPALTPARKHSPEEQKLLDFGHQMHKKARDLYPDGFEETRKLSFTGHLKNSMELMQARRIPLFELGFEFDRNYVRPDILLPSEHDAWELVEIKATSHVHENDIKYVAYQYYVITNLGIHINRASLMLLKKGLYVQPAMKASDIFVKIDITDRVRELQNEVVDSILLMRQAFTNSTE